MAPQTSDDKPTFIIFDKRAGPAEGVRSFIIKQLQILFHPAQMQKPLKNPQVVCIVKNRYQGTYFDNVIF